MARIATRNTLKTASDVHRMVADNGITIADALDAIADYARQLAEANSRVAGAVANTGRYLRIEEAIREASKIAKCR